MFSADSGRDEDDASPIPLDHALQVGPREPHAGHDVNVEEAGPIFVRDLEEVLRLEYASIVDEDVHVGKRRHQRLASGRSRYIRCNASNAATDAVQLAGGCIDIVLGAPIDDYVRTRCRQPLGDGVADAGR